MTGRAGCSGCLQEREAMDASKVQRPCKARGGCLVYINSHLLILKEGICSLPCLVLKSLIRVIYFLERIIYIYIYFNTSCKQNGYPNQRN